MNAKNIHSIGPCDSTADTPVSTGLGSQSQQMLINATRTTEFLKSLAHAGRLMILCRLAEGSATVGQLEELLDMSQSSVSKQLARLREEKIVVTTRKGRSIYYSLADEKARRVVSTLYDLFCDPPEKDKPTT